MVPSGCPLVTADFAAGQVKFRQRPRERGRGRRLRGFPSSLPPRVRGKDKTNPGKQQQKSAAPTCEPAGEGSISYALNSF